MASTADFKNGMCLDIEGSYYEIVEFLHVKPGKGPAFVRTKLKNVETGRVLDKTWNSGVKVDEVRIERRPYPVPVQGGNGARIHAPRDI